MFIGIVLAMAVAWGLSIGILYRRMADSRDKRIARYQSDLVRQHSEEVEHMYHQTRGWRHDLKTHIQTMKAYVSLGEYQALEGYLDQLDQDLETVDQIVKTGNVRIDALLNSKLSLARARGIRVEARAFVPKELVVSEVDLGVIIGNLCDNAMEACLQIQEKERRFLRLYMDVMKGQLYIYVINAVEGRPKRVGKRYLTTKGGRDHGYGLLRMDRVVEKYHGYLDRQSEEGVFATEVLLPLGTLAL